MKLFYDDNTVSEKGFVYVATHKPNYYEFALHSLNMLRDFWPDANVTLFANEALLDSRAKQFNKVYTNIPIHIRAKMWCLSKTPYQKTVYIDADTAILNKDIRNIHDLLVDHDLFFTPNPVWAVGSYSWATISVDGKESTNYHGGVVGYNKNDLVCDFTDTWFLEYVKQRTDPWPYNEDEYSQVWQQFDMFTLWKILYNKLGGFDRFQRLKINEVGFRWGVIADAPLKYLDGPIVIGHLTKGYYKGSAASAKKFKLSKEYDNFRITESSVTEDSFKYN
jgi:hypothetical protein